jgi:hypothetical protein
LPIAAKARSGPRFCDMASSKSPELSEEDAEIMPEAAPFDGPYTESPPTAPDGDGTWMDEPGSWTNEPYRYASGEREWGYDIAEYVYKNQLGQPYLKVKRTSTKQFPQYHLEGDRWVKGPPNGPKIPYRLPELMAANPDVWVHLFEGEKDADNGAALGLVATAHSQGAEGWSDNLIPWFIGRRIVVHEDNDNAGRKRTRTVVAALKSAAKEIRVLKYEDLPEKGDFSDWLDQGHTLAEVNQRVESARPYRRGLEVHNIGDLTKKPPPRGWLQGNNFCRKFLSQLLADGGVGKTSLRYAQYLSLASSRELTGEHIFERGRVLVLSLEDGVDELERRLWAATLRYNIDHKDIDGWLFYEALGRKAGRIKTIDEKGRVVDGELASLIEETIVEHKIDLVGIDPFVKTHSVGENNNDAIDAVAQVLTDLAEAHNIAVDVPHHISKGQADPGNAQRGRGASAFVDAGRLVYTLAPMSTEEAKRFAIPEEERHYYIRLDKGKVNTVRPARVAKWFKLVGVPLNNPDEFRPQGDEVQTVEPWTPPEIWADLDADMQNAILDTIEAGLPSGSRYSDGSTAKDRAAWRVVIKHAPDKNEAQAREIIKTWVKSGVLETQEYEDPVRRETVKGLFVVEEKRPK